MDEPVKPGFNQITEMGLRENQIWGFAYPCFFALLKTPIYVVTRVGTSTPTDPPVTPLLMAPFKDPLYLKFRATSNAFCSSSKMRNMSA